MPSYRSLSFLLAAFAASLATAAADTVGSEIGQLSRTRPRLLTNLRIVPAGTDGAVSTPGTLASMIVALMMAVMGHLLDLYPPAWVPIVGFSAFGATLAESLLGAGLERAGRMHHEEVNLAASALGSVFAIALILATGR